MVLEIQKRNSTGHELKSFTSFSSRGILLYRQNYQENDLIVDLLLEKHVRLSALVRGGQKSLKRFGGKLEPLKLLSMQLRAPKGVVSFDKLFSLEAADIVESFDEYRSGWNQLNEGLFYTEFFRDFFPKGDMESWMYEQALKTLVAGSHLCSDAGHDWRRVYVWFYFSKHEGLFSKFLTKQNMLNGFHFLKKVFSPIGFSILSKKSAEKF
jgi:hypothetical protein